MKEKVINRKWFFYKDWDDSIKEAVRPSGFEEVTLPHSVVSTPFN